MLLLQITGFVAAYGTIVVAFMKCNVKGCSWAEWGRSGGLCMYDWLGFKQSQMYLVEQSRDRRWLLLQQSST